MVSTLESNYCVDQSRIFSMGFSYGGMMSITIGCLLPNVFRAIGVESGFSIVYNCNPSHEIAVWQTQGDQDTTVTPTNAEAARDTFVKLNHCASTTQAVNPSPCVAYDNCDTGYPVTWCLIAGVRVTQYGISPDLRLLPSSSSSERAAKPRERRCGQRKARERPPKAATPWLTQARRFWR